MYLWFNGIYLKLTDIISGGSRCVCVWGGGGRPPTLMDFGHILLTPPPHASSGSRERDVALW